MTDALTTGAERLAATLGPTFTATANEWRDLHAKYIAADPGVKALVAYVHNQEVIHGPLSLAARTLKLWEKGLTHSEKIK